VSPRTEQELLDCVLDLARLHRWAIHHDRPARRAGARWSTAIAGHAGFPDLVLARQGVVLFRELKGYDRNGRMGRLSSEQRDWARQLAHWSPAIQREQIAPALRIGWLFDVWTPDDWNTIIVPTLTDHPRIAA